MPEPVVGLCNNTRLHGDRQLLEHLVDGGRLRYDAHCTLLPHHLHTSVRIGRLDLALVTRILASFSVMLASTVLGAI